LEYASLLHDIGYHISYEKHHRHAYYLIKNVQMNGFTEEEVEIMALVTRYHRRSIPKKTHLEFTGHARSVRNRIEWLAAILRVADALDRSHFSVVSSVKVKSRKKTLTFRVAANNDVEYEIWDARRKCDLFEKLCHKEILFESEKVKKIKHLHHAPLTFPDEKVKKLARAL
jgi:exopolyphosphatase/guanosine-5'-triphosphate,3'-diphosphate pyrophosphatase